MGQLAQISVHKKFKLISDILLFVVIGIETLACILTIVSPALSKAPFSNIGSVSPLTAGCFILLSIALLLKKTTINRTWVFVFIYSFSLIVFFIASLKLTSILFNWKEVIDIMRFYGERNAGIFYFMHFEMEAYTSICLIIASISVILSDYKSASGQAPYQVCALVLFFSGLLSFLEYVYGVGALHLKFNYTNITFHLSICFILFAIALLFQHPNWGFMRQITDSAAGGFSTRILMPFAILIPTILGFLRLYAVRTDFISREFATSLHVLAIIMCFILVIWYVAFLINRKDKLRIHAENVLVQSRKELEISYKTLRELASHLQNIREEERKYISREIHDELGQQLTVMKMDVSWMKKKLEQSDESIKNKIDELLVTLDGTVGTVRALSSRLRPSLLDDLGLVAAIEWQLNDFGLRSGFEIRADLPHHKIVLNESMATALFRIFQESLTNVARHSGAKSVEVKLKVYNDNLLLSIKDDGKGYKENIDSGKKTLGILGMKERAIMIGGKYSINGIPGCGTLVSVSVPITKNSFIQSEKI